jgi:RHS repeat-associated protein
VDSNGFWDVPGNWDTGKVPGSGDDVVIDRPAGNFTVTVRDHETINTLVNKENLDIEAGGGLRVQGAGTLDSSLTLNGDYLEVDLATTLNGTLNWKAGTLITSGQALSNAGVMALSNSSDVVLSGYLINNATLSESGAGNLSINNTFTNGTTGVIDFQSDVGITGNGVLNNSGTIRKSAGAGISRIGPADSNSTIYFNQLGGTLDAQSGSLRLDQTRTSVLETGATWNAEAGATLDFVGNGPSGTYFAGNFTGSGAGTVQLSSGSFGIDSGGATFHFPAGLLHWAGGTFFANPLTNTGNITLTGANDKSFTNTLNNTGTIIVTGTGNLVDLGILHNNTGGVIDFRSDAGISANGELDNAGSIIKSAGTGVSRVGPAANALLYFDQFGGTLDAQSGTLRFDQTRTSQTESGGVWNAETSATLEFVGENNSGTYFNGTFTGSGAGAVVLSAGLFGIDSGGATFNFPTGLLQWTGGMFFSHSLTNAGFMTVAGSGDKVASLPFTNQGSITVTGTGNLVVGNVFTNSGTGLIDIRADGGITGNGEFDNSGTIRKSAGSGVSRIGPSVNSTLYFNQLGNTLDAESGTLRLDRTRTDVQETGGTWIAAAGATLDFVGEGASGTFFAGNFTGSGAGAILLDGGFFEMGSGGATFNFPGNLLQWVGGQIDSAGANPFTNAGTLTLSGANDKTLTNYFINSGLMAITGTGNLNVINYGNLTNQPGGIIDFQSDGSINGTALVTNNGFLRKSTGAGVSVVAPQIYSTNGTFAAETGRLNLSGGGSWQTATLNAAASAVLEVTGAPSMSGAFTGSGAGRLELSGGFSPVDGGVAGASMTFNFAADFLHWTGGEIDGGIPFTNVGFMTIDGPNSKYIRRNTIINTGTIIDSGPGDILLHGNGDFATSNIDNRTGATFELDGGVLIDELPGNKGLFINAGTLRKAGADGTADIDGFFNSTSSGSIVLDNGQLKLGNGGTFTGGSFNLASGTVLVFALAPGYFVWTGHYTGAGLGTIDFQGGLSGGDDSSPAFLNFVPGYFHMSGAWGGTIENDGTITLDGNFARAHIINVGTMIQSGPDNFALNANTYFENRGLFDIQSDASLVVPGDASGGNMRFLNTGTLRKSSGSGTSQLRHDGSGKAFQLDNQGVVEVDSGALAILDPIVQLAGTTLSAGTWIVRNGATLTFPAGTSISTNQASVTLDGATSSFAAIANLASNAGSFTLRNGNNIPTIGNLANSGTLVVGAGSKLTVNGNLTEVAGSRLRIEIGGHPSSQQFGQVSVTGQASLAGALFVQLVGGFGPSGGDQFSVLTYAAKQNSFTDLSGIAPFFTANVGNTSTVLTSTGPAANLAAQSITTPPDGTVGQTVSIDFTISNTAAVPIDGNWTDSVYLSRDTLFGPDDVLLARVPHQGGLAAQGSYQATATATLPGLIDRAYHIIVVADSSAQVADTNRADNTLVSSSTIQVHVPALTLGTPLTGTIAQGQNLLYRIDVPTGGGDLVLSTSVAVSRAADILVRYAALPDTDSSDVSFANQTGLNAQLVIANPIAGSYYVLVQGREAASTPQSFSLGAKLVGFGIRGITPSQGSNAGKTTITVTGSGFTPASTVTLVSGAVTRAATTVLYENSNTLFATMDLGGLSPGLFDVEVSNGSVTQALGGAFTVNASNPGQLVYQLDIPANLRVGAVTLATITYRNTGGTDLPAPLLLLSSDNAKFRLNAQDPWQTGSIQLLGFNRNGPAGILPAGAAESIQVQFAQITSGAHVPSNFTLSTGDPTQTIDWASLKSSLQPIGLQASAWNAIYANFVSTVGSTVGSYQSALDDAATYLSQLGEYTPDLTVLQSHLLQVADNFGAVSQANTLGQLGWGNFGPNDANVLSTSDGNIVISSGSQTRFFYANSAGSPSFHGAPGDSATATLNASAQTFVVREPNGSTETYAVSLSAGAVSSGKLSKTQDANGNTVAYSANGFSNSFGDTTTFSTDAQGALVVTDPVGRVTTYAFDAFKNLISVTNAAGTTSFTYLAGQAAATNHLVQSITYPDGTHEHFAYDNLGRVTQQSFGNSANLVTFSYGQMGQVTITDATGAKITLSSNDLGQVARVEDPLGQVLSSLFDANRNPSQYNGPQGSKDSITYNGLNNPASITDPMGSTIGLKFDPATDAFSSLTDPNGVKTSYSSDSRGNITTVTYADGTTQQFQYDAIGNLTKSTDQLGQATQYTYDSHNLLTGITYADGSTVTYTYDAHRNLVTATDASGVTTFTYDLADRLTKVTYPSGKFVAYSYNALGQRMQMTTSDSATVSYTYDPLGRLSTLTDGSGNPIVTYAYNAIGLLSQENMGNGASTTYTYDAERRLISLVNSGPGATVISSFAYVYNSLGMPVSVTTPSGTTTYGYDADGQLTSVNLPGGDTFAYQYDAAGNRVSVTDNGVTAAYTTTNMNEYTGAGTTSYTHNAAGQVTSMTNATGTTSYSYNAAGQLVSVIAPTDTFTYQYDALGNLLSSTHNGAVTTNLIDPTGLGNIVAQYTGGTLTASFTYGLGLTGQVSAAGAAYYAFDAVGNTVNLTGPNGAVLNSYAYLPFGEAVGSSGTTPNPFTFAGQYGVSTDGNGLFNMRNRWYDPSTGRFTQPDPSGLSANDVNLYRYAANRPVSFVDPSGLDTVDAGIAGGVGGGGTTGFQVDTDTGDIYWYGGVGATTPGAGASLTASNSSPSSGFSLQGQLAAGPAFVGAAASNSVPLWSPGSGFQNPLDASNWSQSFGGGGGLGGSKVFGAGLYLVGTVRIPIRIKVQSRRDLFNDDALRRLDNDQNLRAHLHQVEVQQAKAAAHIPGDPNDISGPAGSGIANFVSPAQTFSYVIEFENLPTADAPAQVVTVTQQLDSNLDWNTFQLGGFGFDGQTFDVPGGLAFYQTRVDARATLGIYVDISASFNALTGKLTWTFTSIDPATGDLPADVLTGFLPPDVTDPQGAAFISYSVLPKPGLTTGAVVSAKATVIFDAGLSDQSSLDTPVFTNAIDAGAPTSSATTAKYVGSKFTVSWVGTDDSGGSGIDHYDVYVSDNGGAFTPFLLNTTSTSATFTGVIGHTYGFYSVATDGVGFAQPTPTASQTTAQAILDTPNKEYVAAVYIDLLMRSVDLGGLAFWSGQLQQGAARDVIAAQLTHSAEYYKTNVIVPAYHQFLGRDADPGGIQYWTQQLQGGLTDEQMQGGFIASPEFYKNAGGTDKLWIDALYQALLDRQPDASGENYWLGQLQGHQTRTEVANDFTGSPEGLGDRVQQTYQRYLGRKAGQSEVAFWVGQYHQGKTNEDIVTGFLASEEYFKDHTT